MVFASSVSEVIRFERTSVSHRWLRSVHRLRRDWLLSAGSRLSQLSSARSDRSMSVERCSCGNRNDVSRRSSVSKPPFSFEYSDIHPAKLFNLNVTFLCTSIMERKPRNWCVADRLSSVSRRISDTRLEPRSVTLRRRDPIRARPTHESQS